MPKTLQPPTGIPYRVDLITRATHRPDADWWVSIATSPRGGLGVTIEDEDSDQPPAWIAWGLTHEQAEHLASWVAGVVTGDATYYGHA